jgi:hypothetical protein
VQTQQGRCSPHPSLPLPPPPGGSWLRWGSCQAAPHPPSPTGPGPCAEATQQQQPTSSTPHTPPPCPHLRCRVVDAPALGCAVLAAVAAGCYPDVVSAAKAMVQVRAAAARATHSSCLGGGGDGRGEEGRGPADRRPAPAAKSWGLTPGSLPPPPLAGDARGAAQRGGAPAVQAALPAVQAAVQRAGPAVPPGGGQGGPCPCASSSSSSASASGSARSSTSSTSSGSTSGSKRPRGSQGRQQQRCAPQCPRPMYTAFSCIMAAAPALAKGCSKILQHAAPCRQDRSRSRRCCSSPQQPPRPALHHLPLHPGIGLCQSGLRSCQVPGGRRGWVWA